VRCGLWLCLGNYATLFRYVRRKTNVIDATFGSFCGARMVGVPQRVFNGQVYVQSAFLSFFLKHEFARWYSSINGTAHSDSGGPIGRLFGALAFETNDRCARQNASRARYGDAVGRMHP
jgi:hypothetical protein